MPRRRRRRRRRQPHFAWTRRGDRPGGRRMPISSCQRRSWPERMGPGRPAGVRTLLRAAGPLQPPWQRAAGLPPQRRCNPERRGCRQSTATTMRWRRRRRRTVHPFADVDVAGAVLHGAVAAAAAAVPGALKPLRLVPPRRQTALAVPPAVGPLAGVDALHLLGYVCPPLRPPPAVSDFHWISCELCSLGSRRWTGKSDAQ